PRPKHRSLVVELPVARRGSKPEADGGYGGLSQLLGSPRALWVLAGKSGDELSQLGLRGGRPGPRLRVPSYFLATSSRYALFGVLGVVAVATARRRAASRARPRCRSRRRPGTGGATLAKKWLVFRWCGPISGVATMKRGHRERSWARSFRLDIQPLERQG